MSQYNTMAYIDYNIYGENQDLKSVFRNAQYLNISTFSESICYWSIPRLAGGSHRPRHDFA